MKYRVGLDIGIASVGWCATETDNSGEPVRIINLGSRIFDTAENPKTKESLSAPRRAARGLRRVLRRRGHRVERAKNVIARFYGDETVGEIEKNEITDVLALRVKGLDEPLTPVELGKLCLYFVKHRGFKSNAISDSGDDGKLKKATEANKNSLAQSGYRTWGEYLAKSESIEMANGTFRVTRNKGGDYKYTPLRAMISSEIDEIMSAQKKFGVATDEFIVEYKAVFDGQRSFDEGPGKPSKYRGMFERSIGKCTLERDEYRGAKAAYTVEFTIALEKLNNLRINYNGETRELAPEQREKIIELIKNNKEVKLALVRKTLGLSDNDRFNITYSDDKKGKPTEDEQSAGEKNFKSEDKPYFKMTNSYSIAKCLSADHATDYDLLDAIAEVLTRNKSEIERNKKLAALGLCADEIQPLVTKNMSGFSNLSIKARRKLLPKLLEGKIYTEAVEEAGYGNVALERKRLLKGDEIKAIIDEIGSPVVRRAVSQTIKVVNALVCAYGSPVGVNIEVARELSKTAEERNKIEKANKDREKANVQLEERIREYKSNPSGLDYVKVRLYDEQGGKCAYSGKEIDFSLLLSDGNYAQVDHILPFSRSLDDGFNNKTLVLTSENQNKGNRTPYEFFGADEQRWSEFESRIAVFGVSPRKRDNYLKKNFDNHAAREWRERNLNDTKYITSFIYNLINDRMLFESLDGEKENARKVYALSGFITSYLRKFWGFNKVREDGDKHHALDAAIISVTTPKLINNVTRYNKMKECFFRSRDGKVILIPGLENEFQRDEHGRIIDSDGLVIDSDGFDMVVGKNKFPAPYEDFRDELLLRLCPGEETDDDVLPHFSESQRTKLSMFGYSDEEIIAAHPIFVSRMPRRKVTGAIHEATVWSNKYAESDNIVVKKTSLENLKLDKNGEITGYYNPSSDKLLYDALKARLVEYDGDGKKAFAEPFFKPKSDGTPGARVRSVKIQESAKRGVVLENKNGYVKNDTMVRVDVFTKGGKFYCVPVYVYDVAKGVLPNKAISGGKEWTEMDETFDFIFSLYKNDLVYVESNKPFNLTSSNKVNKEKIEKTRSLMYYSGIDSSTGAAGLIMHDNSFETRLGLKTLKKFKKYVVDVLGNVTEVKKETRQPLKENNKKFK